MAGMGGSQDGCRVYLITPPTLDPRRSPTSSRPRSMPAMSPPCSFA